MICNIDMSIPRVKAHVVAGILVLVSMMFTFIAFCTPAWQVAMDLDAGRWVESGLWLYCPGAGECWYIFSDALYNYYEKVDVCRFLLFADCRTKMLKTPYFFGWHYAVAILTLVALFFSMLSLICLVIIHIKRHMIKLFTVIFDMMVAFAFVFDTIALSVFMINAEMLESRYLIGIKNIFPKSYGYSFFLDAFAMSLLLFAMLAGIVATTFVFFNRDGDEQMESSSYGLKSSAMQPDYLQNRENYLAMQRLQLEQEQNLKGGAQHRYIPVIEQERCSGGMLLRGSQGTIDSVGAHSCPAGIYHQPCYSHNVL